MKAFIRGIDSKVALGLGLWTDIRKIRFSFCDKRYRKELPGFPSHPGFFESYTKIFMEEISPERRNPEYVLDNLNQEIIPHVKSIYPEYVGHTIILVRFYGDSHSWNRKKHLDLMGSLQGFNKYF